MVRRLLMVFLLGTVLLFGHPTQGEQRLGEAIKNKLLKEELTLARTPASYLILDLPQKSIRLKASGMTLREWKVEKIRTWGNPASLQVITLQKKSALFAPKRKKIKPGNAQSGDTFELNILELKDMPSVYVLSMTSGLAIYVRSGSGNFFTKMASLGRSLKWYFWLPLKNLWLKLRKKPLACLDIRLSSPQEAKALYWAIGEGFRGIVYPKN